MTENLASFLKRNWIPLCILLASLLTTIGSWHLANQYENRKAEYKFTRSAEIYQQQLERRLETYIRFLDDLASLMTVDQSVSGHDFDTFIYHANIMDNYPGTKRIGYLPRVPGAQKAHHEAQMRAAGFTGYRIKAEGPQAEYYPYDYLYPKDQDARQHLLGVDEHNEPTRREALQKARDWDQVVATRKLNKRLVPNKLVSFLLYSPIYTRGLPILTVDQRRKALKGYVYAAFRAEDLIKATWGDGVDRIANVRFTAGSNSSAPGLIYASPALGTQQVNCTQCFKYTGAFEAGGQQWSLELYPLPSFFQNQQDGLPAAVLIGGLIMSLLLTAIAILVNEKRYWSALQQEQDQQFRSLFEQNPDAVYSFDLQGNFINANTATQQLTGLTLDKLRQTTFARFIVPDELGTSTERLEQVVRGIPAHGETTMINAAGHRVELSTTNLPIIVNGRVIGVFGIAKDITGRKAAEAALQRAHAELEARVKERTAALYTEMEARRESEEQFRSIFEQAPVGIMHIGLDGQWLRANQKASEIFGYTPEEMRHLTYAQVSQAEDLEVRNKDIEALKRGEIQSIERESRFMRKDGTVAWTNLKRSIVRDQMGHPKYYLAVLEDITARRQIEEALRISEAGLAKAQEIAHLGSWEMDIAKGTLAWSDEVYRIFGLSPQACAVNYETVLRYVHRQDRGLVESAVKEALQARKPFRLDHRILLDDGTERVVHEEAEIIYDADGRPIKMIGTVQDITERKQAEDALRELSSHLQTVREEERARIAREIHDELGGTLAAIKFDLSLPMRQEDKDFSGASQRNPEIIRLVDAAIVSLRRIMADLRPSVLDDLGLWAALEWLAGEFQARMGIATTFRIKGEEMAIEPNRATALFRIVQEALNNVAKHAQATRVTITATTGDTEVSIRIRDNGCGMTREARRKPKSFGIVGMTERAQAFNGTIKIHSRLHAGTSIIIRLPMESGPLKPATASMPGGHADARVPA